MAFDSSMERRNSHNIILTMAVLVICSLAYGLWWNDVSAYKFSDTSAHLKVYDTTVTADMLEDFSSEAFWSRDGYERSLVFKETPDEKTNYGNYFEEVCAVKIHMNKTTKKTALSYKILADKEFKKYCAIWMASEEDPFTKAGAQSADSNLMKDAYLISKVDISKVSTKSAANDITSKNNTQLPVASGSTSDNNAKASDDDKDTVIYVYFKGMTRGKSDSELINILKNTTLQVSAKNSEKNTSTVKISLDGSIVKQ